jgi:uncharacterized membrane protein YfcA
MTGDLSLWLLALVIVLAFTVQTVVGFASTVICLTLGAHLLPIRDVVELAVPLSFLQTAYILVRHHDGVRWRFLVTRIVPFVALGMSVGYLAVRGVAGDWLRIAFAVLVIGLAAYELWLLFRAPAVARPMSRAASIATVFVAGLIHGVYATGGPPLAYAVGREELPKHELRSTLCAVWLVSDGVLTGTFALDGRYDAETLNRLLFVLPALPLGIAIGEFMHRRVDEARVKKALSALLLLAGISLLVRP